MIRTICELPKIYSIDVPLPNNPLKNLNCYVVRSGDETLVIDTGFRMPECSQALRQGLDELAVDLNHTSLFLTHLHSDHTGLVDDFVKAGCPIYMDGTDHGVLAQFMATDSRFSGYAQEGFPEADLAKQMTTNPAHIYAPAEVFPFTEVSDGYTFTIGDVAFQCVSTPGHTPGHTCLYIPAQEIMFLGDHVLFDITPNITKWAAAKDSLKTYLQSLDKIASYPMKLALPAHRGNDMDVYERIAEIKAHHQRRLDNTMQILKEHPDSTAYDIASHMQWKMRGKNWSEFPVQQRWFAVGETIAHLDLLRFEDKVQRQVDGAIIRYRLA